MFPRKSILSKHAVNKRPTNTKATEICYKMPCKLKNNIVFLKNHGTSNNRNKKT